jgi:hypothetical protein
MKLVRLQYTRYTGSLGRNRRRIHNFGHGNPDSNNLEDRPRHGRIMLKEEILKKLDWKYGFDLNNFEAQGNDVKIWILTL